MGNKLASKIQIIVGLVAIGILVVSVIANVNVTELPESTTSDITEDVTQLLIQADEEESLSEPEVPEIPFAEVLDPILEIWSRETPANTSVVITDYLTGQIASINPSEIFTTASLYKLFLAYAVYQDADNGEIDLNSSIGDGKTYSSCLDDLLTWSDNDCGILMGKMQGWSELESKIQAEGYTDTRLNNYFANGSYDGDKKTNAIDVSLLLNRLHSGELLSEESTAAFVTHLENQQINNRIPDDLPDGVKFAHKTGDLYDYVHDAGFFALADGREFSFVVMTGGWSTSDLAVAPGYFQELFTKVINTLSDQET